MNNVIWSGLVDLMAGLDNYAAAKAIIMNNYLVVTSPNHEEDGAYWSTQIDAAEETISVQAVTPLDGRDTWYVPNNGIGSDDAWFD